VDMVLIKPVYQLCLLSLENPDNKIEIVIHVNMLTIPFSFRQLKPMRI